MFVPPSPGGTLSRSLRASPAAASATAICVGLLVLLGWVVDVEFLKRIVPGMVAMNPLTAVLFIISGLAFATLLRFPASRHAVWVSRGLALLVIWLGVVKLATLWGDSPSYVDTWLFSSKLIDPLHELPNRMAPNTALNFIIVGLAVLGLSSATLRLRLVQACAILVGFGAILPITGYAYGVRTFSGIASFIPMALHTAITFLVLAFGLFFAVPEAPLTQVVVGHDSRGIMARRLLPASVGLILALGWARLWGERNGYYDSGFGTTLFAIVLCLLLVVLVRWTVSAVDKIERKRAETQARLDDLSRHKDEMVAFVSHDLCSPLTGLRMVIDLLRAGNGKPADDLLEMMDQSTRRLVSMARGLLDVTKSQPDQVRLESGDLRVSDLVRHSMEPLMINARAKQIDFRLEVAPDEPLVHADSIRLTQVFNNLLSNAVKFTPSGGSILTTIEPAYAGVRIRIKDSGIGIAENDLPHIFDRYYQGGTKGTAGEAGAGLGLAIVREMVHLHDGYVNVESERRAGTTFTVYLPLGGSAVAA